MNSSIPNLSGQWLGEFKYGPEYSALYGEIVTFSFIIEELSDNQFEGKCYELEGVGMNETIATLKGYREGDNIHFTKEYPIQYQIEQDGSSIESNLISILTYDGQFDFRTMEYKGQWELETNLGPTIYGDLLNICTGTWQMSKCK